MTDRPAIPAELRRQILAEAGHRCSIHTCQHPDVEVHHIVPWAKCKEHRLENLIALCPNCHTRVENGDIDQKSLHIYKARLKAAFRFEPALLETPYNITGSSLETVRDEGAGFVYYTVAVEYPRFRLPSSGKADLLNDVVRGLVIRELLCFRAFPLCADSWRERERGPHTPYQLSGSFEVAMLRPEIVSLRLVFTSYTGGTYSNTRFRSLNFQIEPDVFLIEAWSLFKNHYRGLELISDFAISEIAKHIPEADADLRSSRGAKPSPENFRNLNIHRHGISVDFDEHQLAGKWLGAQSVFVPFDVIADELNPACAVAKIMNSYP